MPDLQFLVAPHAVLRFGNSDQFIIYYVFIIHSFVFLFLKTSRSGKSLFLNNLCHAFIFIVHLIKLFFFFSLIFMTRPFFFSTTAEQRHCFSSVALVAAPLKLQSLRVLGQRRAALTSAVELRDSAGCSPDPSTLTLICANKYAAPPKQRLKPRPGRCSPKRLRCQKLCFPLGDVGPTVELNVGKKAEE